MTLPQIKIPPLKAVQCVCSVPLVFLVSLDVRILKWSFFRMMVFLGLGGFCFGLVGLVWSFLIIGSSSSLSIGWFFLLWILKLFWFGFSSDLDFSSCKLFCALYWYKDASAIGELEILSTNVASLHINFLFLR